MKIKAISVEPIQTVVKINDKLIELNQIGKKKTEKNIMKIQFQHKGKAI